MIRATASNDGDSEDGDNNSDGQSISIKSKGGRVYNLQQSTTNNNRVRFV